MSTEKKVVEVKVDDILPNRFQPRIKFDEDAIIDLSASIKEHGVIQPLVVRKVGDKYEIIAGERRYKASVMAGLETVPVIITELNDKDSAEVALIENVQRQNLTPIEEAVSYKKILDMGYLTQEQLANKLGKSQSAIANKLRLLNLTDDVQEALLNGQISERHARSLLKLMNQKQQKKMLNRIIDERLTVRRTDEEIGKMLNDLFEADEEVEETKEKKELEPLPEEEKEDEIEHTQPLTFDFSSYEDKEPKENVFDMQEGNAFGMKSKDDTDFFGFNQNIMLNKEDEYDSNEPIEEQETSMDNDFVDINKIQEQSEDLYPKKDKKDINSFLEPTLLLNDEDDDEPTSANLTFDQLNSSVEEDADNLETEEKEVSTKQKKNDKKESKENKEEVNPFNENEENIELNESMKPGKFFNLFNDIDIDEPVENSDFNSIFDNSELPQDDTFNFDAPSIYDKPNEEKETSMTESNFEESSDKLEEIIPQKLEAEEISVEKEIEPKEENNIDLAREKIKLYAEELKKLGIDMNIEESDFENKYQITINIDK